MAAITKTFPVSGIMYESSADTVTKQIQALNGTESCSVSTKTNTMTVTFDPEILKEEEILNAVSSCGYAAYRSEKKEAAAMEEKKEISRKSLQILCALSALIFLLHIAKIPDIILFVLSLASFAFSVDLYKEILADLKQKQLPPSLLNGTAAVLSVLGSVICLIIQNPDSWCFSLCTAVILSAAAGFRILMEENRTLSEDTLSKNVEKTMPKSASTFTNGRKEEKTDVSSLQESQIIVIRPGDTVPADGKVIRGFARMDINRITGFENPVEKGEGSYVYAGSVCVSGSIEMKAEKIGNGTAMMSFAKLAEKTAGDTSFPSPFQKYGKYLFGYMILAALLVFAGWLVSSRSFSLAYGCMVGVIASASVFSLSLASSNTVMNAARLAAKKHILFCSADALNLVGKSDYVAVEQEGTLSEKDLIVTDFIPLGDISASRLEYMAYALQSRSDRPFAKAITRYLKTRKISGINAQEFSYISARGRTAFNTMSKCTCGSLAELKEKGIEIDEETERRVEYLQNEGKRVLVIAEEGSLAGIIAAVRPAVPESTEALEKIHNAGAEVYCFASGSPEENAMLKNSFAIDHVIENPSEDEKGQILDNLAEDEDTVVTYITAESIGLLKGRADVTAAIVTDPSLRESSEADILLTRNRLKDFCTAMDISSACVDLIGKCQLWVILYHAAAVLLFGFLIPKTAGFTFSIILASAASILCLLVITRKSGSFPVIE